TGRPTEEPHAAPHRLCSRGRQDAVSVLDWHPLFTGTPDAASDLALELGRHGLRSFVQDRDGAIQMHGGSRERWGVVLVPPEETEAAKAVATRWHAQNELDAIRLTARI